MKLKRKTKQMLKGSVGGGVRISYKNTGRRGFTHTKPFPCHATNMPFTTGSWQADGMRTAWEMNVSDLPAVGVFLLPRGVPGSLLSETGGWQSRSRIMVCVNRALTR